MRKAASFKQKKYPIPSNVIDSQAFHKDRRSAQLFSCLKEGNGAIIIFYPEYKKNRMTSFFREKSEYICVHDCPSVF